MTEALAADIPVSNPVHEPFMGIFYACRACQLVGIPCAVDRLPGMQGIMTVDLDESRVANASESVAGALSLVPVSTAATVETIDLDSDGTSRPRVHTVIIFARTKAPAKSCVSTVQRSSKRKAKSTYKSTGQNILIHTDAKFCTPPKECHVLGNSFSKLCDF